LAVNGSPRELRPQPRHSGPGGLIDVTFYSFPYYGGLLASERGSLSVAFFLLEAPFFVVTALRFACYILAQKNADAHYFWQVCALFERRRVRAVPIQPRRRTDRHAPVPVQRSEADSSKPGGVPPPRPCWADGPATQGLATCAVAVLALTRPDGWSGFASPSAGGEPLQRPWPACPTEKSWYFGRTCLDRGSPSR
jgi:hypothetical protein